MVLSDFKSKIYNMLVRWFCLITMFFSVNGVAGVGVVDGGSAFVASSGARSVPITGDQFSGSCDRCEILAQMTLSDFREIFQQASEHDILINYPLYAYTGFCAFVCTLSSYEEFMLSLQKRIENNKEFRKTTEKMPSFYYSYSIWSKTKSGFHDFVNAEANRIKNEKTIRKVYGQKKDLLNQQEKDVEISNSRTGSPLRMVEFQQERLKFLLESGTDGFETLDPRGNSDVWLQKIVELAQYGDGEIKDVPAGQKMKITGFMPKSNGAGYLGIGVRLFKETGRDTWEIRAVLMKKKE